MNRQTDLNTSLAPSTTLESNLNAIADGILEVVDELHTATGASSTDHPLDWAVSHQLRKFVEEQRELAISSGERLNDFGKTALIKGAEVLEALDDYTRLRYENRDNLGDVDLDPSKNRLKRLAQDLKIILS